MLPKENQKKVSYHEKQDERQNYSQAIYYLRAEIKKLQEESRDLERKIEQLFAAERLLINKNTAAMAILQETED